MAKQQSIFKLKGTIDGVTFYKTAKDGHLAKAKGGVDKQRIRTDPRFARTRENGAEFGNAGRAGRTLRNAIRDVLAQCKDNRVTSRLTTAMLRIAKTDATNERGNRMVAKGAIDLLHGFDFNINAKQASTFTAPFSTAINRAAGTLKLDVPAFVPKNEMLYPQGATHFKITSTSAEIDFQKEFSNVDHQESATLPIDSNLTAAISMLHNGTAGSALPLFLFMGIQFFQIVNGLMYPLKNGTNNSLTLVAIDKP